MKGGGFSPSGEQEDRGPSEEGDGELAGGSPLPSAVQ